MNTDFPDRAGPVQSARSLFDEEMDLFREYLASMEAFLEAKQDQLVGPFEGLSVLRPPRDEYQAKLLSYLPQIRDELHKFGQLFTNTLRKSFLVAIYGFLESQLNTFCRDQGRASDIRLSVSDISGTGIERAKTYVVKVLGVSFSFGTSPEWREIQEYRTLRNCVVHNEGRLDEGMGSGNASKLRRYVERKQTLHLSGDEVLIEKGFCEEMCHTIHRFLISLLFPSET